jgi:DNA helicase-2/ATP-dependent DNA helicase PcrA
VGGRSAAPRSGGSSFVGGTPKAAQLAARLGLDGAQLATASELRRQVPSLAAGDRVTHQRYGVGRVLAVEGYGVGARAQIDFGDEKVWIVLRHAPIEKL